MAIELKDEKEATPGRAGENCSRTRRNICKVPKTESVYSELRLERSMWLEGAGIKS